MDRTDRDDDAPSANDASEHAETERDDIAARVARFKAMQQRLTRAREDDAKAIWDNRLATRRQSRA